MKEKYIFSVPQKALIKKDNKFLTIKRSLTAPTYPNHWDLPGGKLEHGEDYKKGLEREVKEETNLEIKVNNPLFVYIETAKANAYVTIFNCGLIDGEIKLSFEHTDYRWVTKEELLEMEIEPFLRAYLEKNNL